MSTKNDEFKTKIPNAKRKITNFVKCINGYVAERDFPPLGKRIKDIELEFELFNKCYTQLEILVEDPTHAESRTEYEEKFYSAFGKATSFLNESGANQFTDSSSAQSTEREPRPNIARNSKKSLPRVNLPTFSGSYEYSKTIDFLALNQISKSMPSISINRSSFEIQKNISLADPEVYKPSEIDALLGVKLFFKLLCVGQISLKNHPNAVFQKTHLGWIVAREINSSALKNSLQCHFLTHSTPSDANLTKFWEMEEYPLKHCYPQRGRHVKITSKITFSAIRKVAMSLGCPSMKRKKN